MLARRRVKIALSTLLVVVLVLALAQVLLPIIAEKVVRDRVSRYGEVRSVKVSAFPAVTLLFGEAQSVSVRTGTLTGSESGLVRLLVQARGTQRVDAHASAIRLEGLPFGASPVVLRDASVVKDGEAIHVRALLSSEAIAEALPRGIEAEVLSSAGGVVSVRASGGLFGFKASVTAAIEAVEGKLMLVPSGPLLAGLGTITLFDDPALRIVSVGATPEDRGEAGSRTQSGAASSWELDLEAKLG